MSYDFLLILVVFFICIRARSLDDSVADPMVAPIDVARFVLFDGVVGKTGGGRVVGLNWSGRLGVAHVMKDLTEDEGFFEVDEKTTDLGFGGGAGDVSEDADGVEDGAVVDFRFGFQVPQVEMSTDAATSLAGVEVASVAVAF